MRINLPGYVQEPGRGGRTRHRVRVKGKRGQRITIPCGPNDPEFMEHYLAARVGKTVQEKKVERPPERTVDALIFDYIEALRRRVDKKTASQLTLKQRKSLLTQAANFKAPNNLRVGDHDYSLSADALEYIRDEWGERTAQADNCVKAMKAMFKWARIRPNPADGIEKVHKSRGGTIPWTTSDLSQFTKHHPPGTTAHLWLMLTLFTGARRDDLARLGRCHERTMQGITWLEFQPSKRGSARVTIPVSPQLLSATRAMKVQGATYLLNDHGKPFKNGNSLGTRVQRWTKDSGLERRSSHGIRKALATLLAEAGCSSRQIAAVLAHTKASTSEIYTSAADRALLAKDAMDSISQVTI